MKTLITILKEMPLKGVDVQFVNYPRLCEKIEEAMKRALCGKEKELAERIRKFCSGGEGK